MRTSFLFPLMALAAVVVGCGSGVKEQTSGSVPQRDLTLVPQAPAVDIASPVEIQRVRIQRRTAQHSVSLAPKVRLAAVWAPAPALAVTQPVAQPASTTPTPVSDRELPPGKTVTMIPVSSGPSAGVDKTDEMPADRGRTIVVGGEGGTCRGRGRGPGIGMAPAPHPDFR